MSRLTSLRNVILYALAFNYYGFRGGHWAGLVGWALE